MHIVPNGTLFLWPDHWQVVGRLSANRPHRHISTSWLVGLDRPFRLQVEGRWRETRAAVVAPDVVQALDPCGARMWCAQLDPDCRLGRQLRTWLDGHPSADLPIPEETMSRLSLTGCEGVGQALADTIAALRQPPAPLDTRIRTVCELLRNELPEKVDVAALAARVEVSASRLSHLFREQVGVPLRRYLLHLKINRVLARWEPGKSMSALASEAGFYDQPHLVRTARNMFDALPSEYVTSGQFSVCRCGLS